ncbi:putative GTPase activating protein (Gyp3) [Aspergillus clavatus NRRL 1]|uniref:GTPase activating protein (Gyp3), putative n=1 Tax=Aspergillus clavatus (strain ATCC 1007 / CBS 513.65 / DSM 816 / NCTC 3887 / NRRL 1 / QM 1276 / 107) TaxID=344612 RepID=A1CL31_ASPCL|nr:GTPase activating protein (Gyp3), putative [Aspergillus clavatus NRRL 1]EAW09855.1 GTPase activating protein (Gyp3), putative [Aspergillus clavatus NRRL 1]
MVTEHGEFRYPPRQAEHVIPGRRRVPHPLRLDPLRIHPPDIRPSTAGGIPRSQSPLLPPVPHPPRKESAYTRPDDPFLRPLSPQIGLGDDFVLRRPPYRSPTFPRSPSPNLPPYEDDFRRPNYRRGPPPGRPGLRISMSTSQMNSRRPRAHHPHDRRPNPNDSPSRGLALPRFNGNGSPDAYGDDAFRSSINSAITSRSSIEHASGTERSSVLTKSSSITDLSPDTPDGPDDKDGGMSVEDAIAMYLDGFSDVTEEPASPGLGDESKLRPISPRPPTDLTFDHGHSSDEQSPDLIPSDHLPPVPQHLPDLNPVDGKLQDEPVLGETSDEAQPPEECLAPKSPGRCSAIEHVEKKVLLPGVVPPPLMPGNDLRDRYGFRKVTHYVTLAQYEAWNGPYAELVANRRNKWMELLKENGLPTKDPTVFPPRTNKVKRFVRKGIPSEFRGAAWFWYAGGYDLLKQNPGLYDRLVKQAMESPNNDDKEHIERDLHRTFPDNLHFKPESVEQTILEARSGSSNPKYTSVTVETQMIQSLRRVLYAFALHNPKVGYTQSLNFITGMLLLFLPEEKAFWMLHIVTSVYLPGTHEISLEGANIDLWILMVLLKESLPHIYNKISGTGGRSKSPALTVDSRLPDITLGLTNWLMSVFIGSLPLETTLRVWDVFFYEGSKTFFRVSLAIFKASEKDILAVSDPMEVFQVVQTVPKKLLDANALLDDSFVRRHRVGQGRIEELRASRRAAVRQEKLRRSLAISKGQLQAATDEWPTTRSRAPIPGLERSLADSWRHMKQHAFR